MSAFFETLLKLDQAAIADLPDRPPTVFVHAMPNLMPGAAAGKLDFVQLLTGLLAGCGFRPVLVAAGDLIDKAIAAHRGHLHIVLGDQPRYAPNVFSVVPAYLNGYWYFDELGSRNNSSIRLRRFHARGMDDTYASQVFERLREKFVHANRSKYAQETDTNAKIEPGAVCIFLQNFKDPEFFPNYIPYPDLIRGVIENRGNRHVYIKPHPLQPAQDMIDIAHLADPKSGISIVSHGIHDLLANADITVTQTSAVGFESFLHKTPVLLAGQTDFHHNAVTALQPSEIGAAMQDALDRHFDYEKYLVWFLKQNLFEPRKKRHTAARCASLLRQKGIPVPLEMTRGS